MKSEIKRRWRNILRYVERRNRQVRVRQLARRFTVAPSTVSRGLRQRKILLEPSAFPWEARSQPERPKRVQKCRQAMALFFLGCNRNQIKRLLAIKSGTVVRYLLALTFTTAGTYCCRMFHDEAVDSLAEELEKAYGLGDHVKEAILYYDLQNSGRLSADACKFVREFHPYKLPMVPLLGKLRQILHTEVRRDGPYACVATRNGRWVRVRALSTGGSS